MYLSSRKAAKKKASKKLHKLLRKRHLRIQWRSGLIWPAKTERSLLQRMERPSHFSPAPPPPPPPSGLSPLQTVWKRGISFPGKRVRENRAAGGGPAINLHYKFSNRPSEPSSSSSLLPGSRTKSGVSNQSFSSCHFPTTPSPSICPFTSLSPNFPSLAPESGGRGREKLRSKPTAETARENEVDGATSRRNWKFSQFPVVARKNHMWFTLYVLLAYVVQPLSSTHTKLEVKVLSQSPHSPSSPPTKRHAYQNVDS